MRQICFLLIMEFSVFAIGATSPHSADLEIHLNRFADQHGALGYFMHCDRTLTSQEPVCTLDRIRAGEKVGTMPIPLSEAQAMVKEFLDRIKGASPSAGHLVLGQGALVIKWKVSLFKASSEGILRSENHDVRFRQAADAVLSLELALSQRFRK